jgi:hypothetical protein
VKYPIRSNRRARDRKGMDPMKHAIRRARDNKRALGWLMRSDVESYEDIECESCL